MSRSIELNCQSRHLNASFFELTADQQKIFLRDIAARILAMQIEPANRQIEFQF
jgi:hypothetical protein